MVSSAILQSAVAHRFELPAGTYQVDVVQESGLVTQGDVATSSASAVRSGPGPGDRRRRGRPVLRVLGLRSSVGASGTAHPEAPTTSDGRLTAADGAAPGEGGRTWLAPRPGLSVAPTCVEREGDPDMANWYYAVGGQTQGPVDEEQMRAMARQGTLTPTSYVVREGETVWQSLGDVEASLGLARNPWGSYADAGGRAPAGGRPLAPGPERALRHDEAPADRPRAGPPRVGPNPAPARPPPLGLGRPTWAVGHRCPGRLGRPDGEPNWPQPGSVPPTWSSGRGWGQPGAQPYPGRSGARRPARASGRTANGWPSGGSASWPRSSTHVIIGIPGVILFAAVAWSQIQDELDEGDSTFQVTFDGRSIGGQFLWALLGLLYFAPARTAGARRWARCCSASRRCAPTTAGRSVSARASPVTPCSSSPSSCRASALVFTLLDGPLALWDKPLRQALHDKLAGSIVVKAR